MCCFPISTRTPRRSSISDATGNDSQASHPAAESGLLCVLVGTPLTSCRLWSEFGHTEPLDTKSCSCLSHASWPAGVALGRWALGSRLPEASQLEQPGFATGQGGAARHFYPLAKMRQMISGTPSNLAVALPTIWTRSMAAEAQSSQPHHHRRHLHPPRLLHRLLLLLLRRRHHHPRPSPSHQVGAEESAAAAGLTESLSSLMSPFQMAPILHV